MTIDLQHTFRGKRVLVTGGLGFIGSNIVRRLAAVDAQVLVVDSLDSECGGNPFNLEGVEGQVEVIVADLRDKGVIEEVIQGQDYLFNMAGRVSHLASMENPQADFEINAGVQLALVEACRKYTPGIKIVFSSTRQIYGRPRYLPVDESHPIDPIDNNGVSKRSGELYHLVAHRVYGLQTVSLRMTNVYGPRMRVQDRRLTFIGWWIRRLLEGEPIPVYGSGRQIRDLNYVDDVIEALLLAAACPNNGGEVYNLGSDEPICLSELARIMVNLHGSGRYELVPFPDDLKRIDIGDYRGDYTKIQRELGWQPLTRLSDGLHRTLAFYAEHRAHYW